ncbi:MAG: hypothetical protein R2748_23460 [Bryobacterales bacterium]
MPMYSASPKAKRVELRYPDPSANPYLAFSAMLMAGLDGIQNKIDPGEPLDKDIYDLSPEELRAVPALPYSLEGCLEALEDDHDFPTRNDVFTEELIHSYISYKMEAEVKAARATAASARVFAVLRYLEASRRNATEPRRRRRGSCFSRVAYRSCRRCGSIAGRTAPLLKSPVRLEAGSRMSERRTFFVENFGCRATQADGVAVAADLRSRGLAKVQTVKRLMWWWSTPVR